MANYNIKQSQEKVLNYLSKCRTDTLHFSGEAHLTCDSNNIKELVYQCLLLSQTYASVNEDDDIETTSRRFRSALDLWRHCKFFNSDIRIFDVMTALYKLSEERKLFGQFCCGVRRRVFFIYNNPYNHTIYNQCYRDEFKLRFSSWKTINKI